MGFFIEKILQKSYHSGVKHISHYTSKSPKETELIAFSIVKEHVLDRVHGESLMIALEGELGAGKTTFVKGFARAMGVKQKITSPTFVIMKVYELKLKNPIFQRIYHVDTYRLKDYTELLPLGIKEIMNDPANLVLIEWSDRVSEILPKKFLKIHLDHVKEKERNITISFLV